MRFILKGEEKSAFLQGWEPFRVSFDPEDLRIEGNPIRMNPAYEFSQLMEWIKQIKVNDE